MIGEGRTACELDSQPMELPSQPELPGPNAGPKNNFEAQGIRQPPIFSSRMHVDKYPQRLQVIFVLGQSGDSDDPGDGIPYGHLVEQLAGKFRLTAGCVHEQQAIGEAESGGVAWK